MSSSTSSSEHWRFFAWVLAALVASGLVINAIPWGGIPTFRRNHAMAVAAIGAYADYVILGDSKVVPFGPHCVSPWARGYRGLGLWGNSATPIDHYHAMRQHREGHPDFAPKVVFIAVGPNNFNANGLHVLRSHTFLSDLDLPTLWELTAAQSEYTSFAEGILARLFPVYGKRVPITHLDLDLPSKDTCRGVSLADYDDPIYDDRTPARRNAIADRNYLDIYRRSVYENYETSPVALLALEKLIELVRSFGGVPVLVALPLSKEMYDLERSMVGDRFDVSMAEVVERHGVAYLDLRDRTTLEFLDVNHLSRNGARDVVEQVLAPMLDDLIGSASRSAAR